MREFIKIIVAILGVVGFLDLLTSSPADDLEVDFKNWMQQHQITYLNAQEQSYRMAIYYMNRVLVQEHNQRASAGEHKYFMALNRFADLMADQYKKLHHSLMKNPITGVSITNECKGSVADAPNPPAAQNWTSKAVEAIVIDQGKCAANWAISAVAAIEGLYALKMEKLVKFSEQQAIDCSEDYGNEGCGGGFMQQAFWYYIDHGIAANKSYPYKGAQQSCKFSPAIKEANFTKCATVPSENYEKLLSAVVQQPVVVSVASQKFMLYERGIYDGECTTDLDRGMLLVGYGSESGTDFWILKNSLGSSWGEKGYIRLKKTSKDGPGMCGIQLAASIPLNIA